MSGIHRGPVNSPHKRPVTRKMSPFHDVIMINDKYYVFNHILLEVVVGDQIIYTRMPPLVQYNVQVTNHRIGLVAFPISYFEAQVTWTLASQSLGRFLHAPKWHGNHLAKSRPYIFFQKQTAESGDHTPIYLFHQSVHFQSSIQFNKNCLTEAINLWEGPQNSMKHQYGMME